MNDKHRKNLAQLADYVEQLPKDYIFFHMEDFLRTSSDNLPAVIDYVLHNGGVGEKCGTAACLVGHAPAAGLFMTEEESTSDLFRRGYPNWRSFTERVFGCGVGDDEFEWMFGQYWSHADNTPHGGAARIRYFLAKGVPVGFDVDYDNPEYYKDYLGLYQELIV